LGFTPHDEDKKNFYGLVKKRRDAFEEENRASQDDVSTDMQDSAGSPKGKWDSSPGMASGEPVLKRAFARAEALSSPGSSTGSESRTAHDLSAWAAFGKRRAEAQIAEENAPEGSESAAEQSGGSEELERILSKTDTFVSQSAGAATASDSSAAATSPASYVPSSGGPQSSRWPLATGERQDDTAIRNTEISALRHNKSDDDILKEFNTIISKSQGADLKDTEAEEESKDKKKRKKSSNKKVKVKIEFEPYDLEKHGAMASFPGLSGYDEIERYWVIEPYSFVVILYNESANTYLYYVCEPSLTVFEKELLEDVYQRLQDLLILSNIDLNADRKEVLVRKATEIIVDYIGKIDTKSYHKIIYYIVRDYLEFGKITPIMHDDLIEDISNNGFDTPIFLYHKNYENIMTNITFGEKQLDSFVIRLAQRCGKHIPSRSR
jgi:Type IV secretory pathway, VirB11 components, and related ATPases involved in archaeal flagella biosynthesis